MTKLPAPCGTLVPPQGTVLELLIEALRISRRDFVLGALCGLSPLILCLCQFPDGFCKNQWLPGGITCLHCLQNQEIQQNLSPIRLCSYYAARLVNFTE